MENFCKIKNSEKIYRIDGKLYTNHMDSLHYLKEPIGEIEKLSESLIEFIKPKDVVFYTDKEKTRDISIVLFKDEKLVLYEGMPLKNIEKDIYRIIYADQKKKFINKFLIYPKTKNVN